VPAFALTEVMRATGGVACGRAPELALSGVSTDTRAIAPGSLFVALRGDRFDAHDFLAAAARGGARAALVERCIPEAQAGALVQIRVADTRKALGELARFHALRSPARRVAVTGSNGKTTTKDLLRAALAAGGPAVASERSFNNDIGLPLTLLQIAPDTAYAALELGTNHPGEIARLADLARPHVGVVTNCAAAHVEHLVDLEGVAREKGALVAALPADGVAILNADDSKFEAVKARARCRVVTFGVRRPADFTAVDIRFDLRRLVYKLRGRRVFVPLGGCHNVYNSLAALAAADAVGVPLATAIRALRRVQGPPMRLAVERLGALTLIDDSYNANPGSVEAAFRTLAAATVKARRVMVLGDMLELGAQAAAEHRRAGGLASLLGDALLIAVGPHAREVAAGALARGVDADHVVTFSDSTAAARAVPALLAADDAVLVKGSRGMAMERVVEAIERVWSRPAGTALAAQR
jgi:UDP-N-acetylmuramoyl-tripeptide--D-alanyl-D-alanine ligase